MVNAHRRRNQISRIKINGSWITKDSAIKEEVCIAFQVLFSTSGEWCPSINGLSFEKLEDTKVAKLEKPFSKEGVFGALLSFSGDKALGLNGFSMTFWQFSWEFVKRKVMNLFKDFHDSSRFV